MNLIYGLLLIQYLYVLLARITSLGNLLDYSLWSLFICEMNTFEDFTCYQCWKILLKILKPLFVHKNELNNLTREKWTKALLVEIGYFGNELGFCTGELKFWASSSRRITRLLSMHLASTKKYLRKCSKYSTCKGFFWFYICLLLKKQVYKYIYIVYIENQLRSQYVQINQHQIKIQILIKL